ncbi:sigma-70 family RNA polymerase sigma factor [Actinomadura rugatobispora]
MTGETMETVQQAVGDRTAAVNYHTCNRELFTLRKELLEQLGALRAMVNDGESDARLELALRRAESELEDVTRRIMDLNLGLVRKYVALFASRSNEHVEDLESAGKIGLLRAICSYDPDRAPFSRWAFKPIQREVLRAVRDIDHPNLNPGDFEKRPAILAAKQAYLEVAGPDAPVNYADVARRAGVSEAQVRRVLLPPRLETLHTPASDQGEDEVAWEERLVDPSPSTEDTVLRRFNLRGIGRDLPKLESRERFVLARRFGLDGEPEESLRAIGERLGLSGERVRQIERKALAKLAETIAGTSSDASGRLAGRAG